MTRRYLNKKNQSASKRDLGTKWESAAESFLLTRGLKTRKRNFYSRFGEIDLIMTEGDLLVFVEVRFRGNDRFGDGATTVTAPKQARLVRTARYYLCLNPRISQNPCRFDVVSISNQDGEVQFHWIKNAFGADTG